MGLSVIVSVNLLCVDLREDKQYLNEHPGIVPITTAQVSCNIPIFTSSILQNYCGVIVLFVFYSLIQLCSHLSIF